MADLLDRDQHFAAGLSRKVLAKLFDLGAFAADDDARTRSVDDDLKTGRCTLDIDVRNTAAAKPSLQLALELEVLGKEFEAKSCFANQCECQSLL